MLGARAPSTHAAAAATPPRLLADVGQGLLNTRRTKLGSAEQLLGCDMTLVSAYSLSNAFKGFPKARACEQTAFQGGEERFILGD